MTEQRNYNERFTQLTVYKMGRIYDPDDDSNKLKWMRVQVAPSLIRLLSMPQTKRQMHAILNRCFYDAGLLQSERENKNNSQLPIQDLIDILTDAIQSNIENKQSKNSIDAKVLP